MVLNSSNSSIYAMIKVPLPHLLGYLNRTWVDYLAINNKNHLGGSGEEEVARLLKAMVPKNGVIKASDRKCSAPPIDYCNAL